MITNYAAAYRWHYWRRGHSRSSPSRNTCISMLHLSAGLHHPGRQPGLQHQRHGQLAGRRCRQRHHHRHCDTGALDSHRPERQGKSPLMLATMRRMHIWSASRGRWPGAANISPSGVPLSSSGMMSLMSLWRPGDCQRDAAGGPGVILGMAGRDRQVPHGAIPCRSGWFTAEALISLPAQWSMCPGAG